MPNLPFRYKDVRPSVGKGPQNHAIRGAEPVRRVVPQLDGVRGSPGVSGFGAALQKQDLGRFQTTEMFWDREGGDRDDVGSGVRRTAHNTRSFPGLNTALPSIGISTRRQEAEARRG